MAMYDNANTVEKSFDINYISEHLIQAQWAEFIELKKAITSLAARNKQPISILDIGIGDGRVVKQLCSVKEIWDCIASYEGIENALPCLSLTKKLIEDLHIHDKVSVRLLEAVNLYTLTAKYDMIITTWFTPGNFYPEDFPFDAWQGSGQQLDLSRNEKFQQVFADAFSLLHPGGEIILGSCYMDNDNNRKKQEAFYTKMGMTVITSAADSFTATKEGFWSQRFTREQIFNYLSFADPLKIVITALDTYDFAMQVRIAK